MPSNSDDPRGGPSEPDSWEGQTPDQATLHKRLSELKTRFKEIEKRIDAVDRKVSVQHADLKIVLHDMASIRQAMMTTLDSLDSFERDMEKRKR
jgi:predicted phage-related endonuclease